MKRNHLLFFAAVGVLAGGTWATLKTLVRFSLESEQYSHILLIPVVCLVLVVLERKAIFGEARYVPRLGALLVLVGAFAYVAALRFGDPLGENDSLSLKMLCIWLMCCGAFIGCYGVEALRRAAFPILFLGFVIPIPERVLEMIVSGLKAGSVEATALLFQLTGVPVFRQGSLFALPGATIEVAEECSGIRSSLVLFITSLLAGRLFLRSLRRRALLCLAAIPITILKNGLRIVTLTILSVYVDPVFLTGAPHRRGGVPFFGLAFLVLMGVLWCLKRPEARADGQAPSSAPQAAIPLSGSAPGPLPR